MNWQNSSGWIVTSGDVKWACWGDEISLAIFGFLWCWFPYVFTKIHSHRLFKIHQRCDSSNRIFFSSRWHGLPQFGCSKWPGVLGRTDDFGILNMTNSVVFWCPDFEPQPFRRLFGNEISGNASGSVQIEQQRRIRISLCTHKVVPWGIFYPGYFVAGLSLPSWPCLPSKLLIDFFPRAMSWLYHIGDVDFRLSRLAHFLPADRSLSKPQSRELRPALKVGI